MIKISDYMGKSVVTLSEAVILGRVTDALYDKRLKRVRFLEVSPNDCGENKKRFLPIKRIRSVKDYISVMNLNGILFEDEADLNRAETIWNAKIVTTEGRSQGSLTDLEIIDSNGALERFMTDYGELSTDKIANVGKHLFIVYEDGVRVSVRRASAPAKIRMPREDYPVEMLDSSSADGTYCLVKKSAVSKRNCAKNVPHEITNGEFDGLSPSDNYRFFEKNAAVNRGQVKNAPNRITTVKKEKPKPFVESDVSALTEKVAAESIIAEKNFLKINIDESNRFYEFNGDVRNDGTAFETAVHNHNSETENLRSGVLSVSSDDGYAGKIPVKNSDGNRNSFTSVNSFSRIETIRASSVSEKNTDLKLDGKSAATLEKIPLNKLEIIQASNAAEKKDITLNDKPISAEGNLNLNINDKPASTFAAIHLNKIETIRAPKAPDIGGDVRAGNNPIAEHVFISPFFNTEKIRAVPPNINAADTAGNAATQSGENAEINIYTAAKDGVGVVTPNINATYTTGNDTPSNREDTESSVYLNKKNSLSAPFTLSYAASRPEKPETVSTAGTTLEEAFRGSDGETSAADIGLPAKIISDYNFLLGRRVMTNIRTREGDILFFKDAVITFALIDRARKSGKLLELILNSK